MLRCPYCHEDVDREAPLRVSCSACGADHHAECFAEGGRCAATACSHDQVRVGVTLLKAEDLAGFLDHPERLVDLREHAPLRRSTPGQVLGGLLVVVGLALLIHGSINDAGGELWFGAGATILGILISLGATIDEPDARVRHPGDQAGMEFDPIFGTYTKDFLPGLPADPTAGVRHALSEGAEPQPDRPPGEPPAECPACAEPLETGPDADLFCYHCGASRVIETRWRRPGEVDEVDVDEKPLPPPRVET